MALGFRGYDVNDGRCAEKAAETLAEAVQDHAGACRCRLCEAWGLLNVFSIITAEVVDAPRETVLVDRWTE